MSEKKCKVCLDSFEEKYVENNVCSWCIKGQKFSEFARACGLKRYPCPNGDRYVYNLKGECEGKKGECIDFMDELWNALVEVINGDKKLLI